MKLIIVDLYGDGEAVSVCEDTPRNDEVIQMWKNHERAFERGDIADNDHVDFYDWMHTNAVTLFPSRKIRV